MEGDGYFTNLLNDGSNPLLWDGLGSNPEEQNVEVTPSVTTSQKRTQNFSMKEDELLVSAWLNVSMDPIQGNNQNRSTYWNRIHEYFHSNKDFSSDRNANSLTHRWGVIQENVNKFTGCVAQIEGRRQSGVTAQDKVTPTPICSRFFIWLYKHIFHLVNCTDCAGKSFVHGPRS